MVLVIQVLYFAEHEPEREEKERNLEEDCQTVQQGPRPWRLQGRRKWGGGQLIKSIDSLEIKAKDGRVIS